MSPAAAKRTLALAGVALLAALVSLALAAPDRNHGAGLPKPAGTWYRALADEIGLHGTKQIRWSFAR